MRMRTLRFSAGIVAVLQPRVSRRVSRCRSRLNPSPLPSRAVCTSARPRPVGLGLSLSQFRVDARRHELTTASNPVGSPEISARPEALPMGASFWRRPVIECGGVQPARVIMGCVVVFPAACVASLLGGGLACSSSVSYMLEGSDWLRGGCLLLRAQ